MPIDLETPSFRRRRRQRGRSKRRHLIETLEPRQMLAADLSLVQSGLRADFFDQVQNQLDEQVFSAPAPLVGTQLQSAQSFVQNVGVSLSDFTVSSSPTIAAIRSELQQELGGLLAPGGITTIGNAGDSEIRFRFDLQDTETFSLDVDFALGDDGVIQAKLGNESTLSTTLDWTWTLEFGVREVAGVSEFFVDTARSGELSADLTATIDNTFVDVKGLAGVFAATMSVDPDAGLSSFTGTYTIDVQDINADEFLTQNEFPFVGVDGTLSGSGQANLAIDAEFFPDFANPDPGSRLFNLAIESDVTIAYRFDQAPTDIFDDATGLPFRTFGDDERIVFSDMALDLGTLFDDFVNPIVTGIQETLEPIEPIVDFMTTPIPVISDLSTRNGGQVINLFTLARLSAGLNGNAIARINRAESTVNLINRILKYVPPGTGDLSDTTAGLGSFEISRNKTKYLVYETQPDDGTPQTRDEKNAENRDKNELKFKTFSDIEPDDFPVGAQRDFFATFAGDLQFPILTDPENLASLLLGDTSPDLFTFGTDLNLGISQTLSFPIFPALLSIDLGVAIEAMIDLDIGYDGLGIDRLSDVLDFSSQSALVASYQDYGFLLADGFYIDDHNPNLIADGSSVSTVPSPTNEQPELVLSASLSAGANAGVDLLVLAFVIDLTARFSANIQFDLNDLPDALPVDQWANPLEPAFPDQADWTYDGRVRLNELTSIIDADPLGLFNVSGELVAGLSVGLRATLGFDPFKITVYDKRWKLFEKVVFNFQIAQLDDNAIIETIQGLRQPLDAPVLGGVDADGRLDLFSGATAGQRRNTNATRDGIDNVVDEAFAIRSFGLTDPDDPDGGETILVSFSETRDGQTIDPDAPQIFARQVFHNVKSISASTGSGNDFIDVNANVASPVDFDAGEGDDAIVHAGSAMGILRGGNGDDLLIGGAAGDLLVGGAGNDELLGGGGADTLRGGSGNDMLDGGFDGIAMSYVDTLDGGLGDDSFNWQVGGGDDVFLDSGGSDELYVLGGNTVVTSGRGAENSTVVPRDDSIMVENTASGLRITSILPDSTETITINDFERLSIAPGDGDDSVELFGLTGTTVTDLGIDLSQSGPNRAGDTVTYHGTGGVDLIDVRPVDATNLGEVENVPFSGQSVVKIADTSLSTARTIYVINSTPDVDRLVVRGNDGDDRLSISPGGNGGNVLDLIGVELLGEGGDDVLQTILLNVDVDGGIGDDTLIVLGSTDLDSPDIAISDESLVVRDASSGDVNSLIGFSNVESMELQLASKILGNRVTVLDTIAGAIAPIRILDADGLAADTFAVESIQSPVVIELVGGDNVVTIGKGGSLALVESSLDIIGGVGDDALVYDASGDTTDRDVSVGLDQVTGLNLPGVVTFDDAVETIELMLGAGDDIVRFGLVGGVPLPATLNRKARVDGGLGGDTLDFTLVGAPAGTLTSPLAPRAETVGVEQILFTNDSSDASTGWLLSEGVLRSGLPAGVVADVPQDYPQVVFDSPDAHWIDIRLGDDAAAAEELRIWSLFQPTTVDLRGGADEVIVGDALHGIEEILESLSLVSDGGTFTIDDTAAALDRSGRIEPGRVSGFGLPIESIEFAGFSATQFIGSNRNHTIEVDDTSAGFNVLLGAGTDLVTVRSSSHEGVIDLGGNDNNQSDRVEVIAAGSRLDVFGGAEEDELVLAPANAPATGSVVDSGLGDLPIRLQFPSLAPEINFVGIDQVRLDLGDRGDAVTLDYTETLDSLQVQGNGGADRLTIRSLGGPVDFNHGGGPDELVIAVTGDPSSIADLDLQANLSFTPGLEQLTVDHSAGTVAVDWIVDSGQLFIAGTPESLLDLSGAGAARVIGGSGNDSLTITEQTDTPVDVTVDGDSVGVVSGEVVLLPGSFLNDEISLPRRIVPGDRVGSLSRDALDVASADFDGDGDNDIFLARDEGNRVLLNRGNGRFDSHGDDLGELLGAHRSVSVDVADLDGDGDVDAWVVNENAMDVIFINQGENEFVAPATFVADDQVLDIDTSKVRLGDLDGDGDIDAVVIGAVNQIWINQGGIQNGIEGDFVSQALPFSPGATDLDLGDIEGDGDLDIVLTSPTGGNAVLLYDGLDASGNLQLRRATSTTYDYNQSQYVESALYFDYVETDQIALGDLDDDGDLDIIAHFDGFVYQFDNTLNNGYREDISPYSVNYNYYELNYDYKSVADIQIGDVDGDGDLDVFVLKEYTFRDYDTTEGYGHYLFYGDGGSIFNFDNPRVLLNSYEYYSSGTSPAVVLSDLDGDGDLDAFVAMEGPDDSFAWTLSGPPLPVVQNLNFGNDTGLTAAGDIDGDGDQDLLIETGDSVSIWMNQGGSQGGSAGSFLRSDQSLPFRYSESINNETALQNILLGDIDGDGDLDAFLHITGSYESLFGYTAYAYSRAWRNQGGTFANMGSIYSPYNDGSAIADVDGDGKQEVLIHGFEGIRFAGENSFGQFGVQNGTFRSGNDLIRTGDVDGDGDLDIVTEEGVLLGHDEGFGFANESTTFEYDSLANSFIPSGMAFFPTDFELGDLDGDGDLDVVAVDEGRALSQVFINDGIYQYDDPATPETLTIPKVRFIDGGNFDFLPVPSNQISLADIDGDGSLDVVFSSNEQPGFVMVSAGLDPVTGFPQFVPDVVDLVAGTAGSQILVFDAEGDSDLDFLVGSTEEVDRLFINQALVQPADITRFVDSGQNLGDNDPFARAGRLGDLDGDGDLDAFLVDDGGNRVWLSQGGFQNGDARLLVDSGQALGGFNSNDVALGDLDGDGDLDAFVANGESIFGIGNRVWINQGGLQGGNPATFADAGLDLGDDTSRTVELADLNGDGFLDAFVGNVSGNRVWLGDGAGGFTSTGQTLGAGDTFDLALGDLDGDGDVDAVALDTDTAEVVWVNQGDGTFTALGAGVSGLETSAGSVELADIDGDGDLDAVIADGISGVRLLTNQSAGGGPILERGATYSITNGYYATHVRVGDLDGDGDLDVLIGDGPDYDGPYAEAANLFSMINQGGVQEGVTGSFVIEQSNFPMGDVSLSGLEIGDIDGDGDIDALALSRGGDPMKLVENASVAPLGFELSWLNGDDPSDPSGDPPVDEFLGGRFTDVALGDLNGDGIIDAFLTVGDGREDQVWFGVGDGTFVNSGQSIGGQSGAGVALADFDLDGDLDAVVVNDGFSAEDGFEEDRIWINDGAGVFSDGGSLGNSVRRASRDVVVGDFDGDTRIDIAVAGDEGAVWLNRNQIFDTNNFIRGGISVMNADAIVTGDLDGDGDLDLVRIGSNGAQISTWINLAAGFQPMAVWTYLEYYDYDEPYGYESAPLPFDFQRGDAVELADVDNDGDLDIVVSALDEVTGERGDRVWINNGIELDDPYSFIERYRYLDLDPVDLDVTPSTQGRAIVAGDFDDDLDTDLFVGNGPVTAGDSHQANQLFLNQGRSIPANLGTFQDAGTNFGTNVGGDAIAAATADLDGDGLLDLFFLPAGSVDAAGVIRTANPIVAMNPGAWEPDFADGFVDIGQVLSTLISIDVALGDLDRDGDLDAFIATDGPTDQVWLNQGGLQFGVEGTFADTLQPFGNTNATSVALGDVDGDGDLDAWVTNDGYEGSPFGYPMYQSDRLWINDGRGRFTDSGQMLGEQPSQNVVLGDIDGDGDLDAITVNGGDDAYDRFVVWNNDGGVFTQDESATDDFRYDMNFLDRMAGATAVKLGDVDGDGDLDAVVAGANVVLTNDGSGKFSGEFTVGYSYGAGLYGGPRLMTFDGGNTTDVQLVDIDRDGDLDIITVVSNDTPDASLGGNRIFLNQFATVSVFNGTTNVDEVQRQFGDAGDRFGALAHVGASGIDLADIDADGDLDALVTNAFGSPNQIFFNQSLRSGFGGFVDNGQNLGTASSSDVEFGDLDGDGDADAFIGNLQRGNQVWINTKVQSGITTLQSVTFSPDGQFVYGVDPNKDAAVVLSVSPEGGFTAIQAIGDGFDDNQHLAGASQITLTTDGTLAYVASPLDNAIVIYQRQVDAAEPDFGQLFSPTPIVNAIFGDVRDLVVSDDGADVYIAAGDRGQLLKTIPTIAGAAPVVASMAEASAVAISPDQQTVFALDAMSETLHVFDRDLNVIGTVDVGFAADTITVTPRNGGGTWVYLAGPDAEALTVLGVEAGGAADVVQTLRNGVGGVRGLGGAKSIAVSPDGQYVYVTSGLSDSLAIFRVDEASGRLNLVQYLRNGNSRTLGLARPNSIAIRPGDGAVVIGSTAGRGIDRGGVASFLSPAALPGAPTTATFTVGFENIESLTLVTAGGSDNFAVLNAPSVDLTIDAGDGDNTIDLFAAFGNTTVRTGDGRDLIDLRAPNPNVNFVVDSGEENDTITLRQLGDGGTILARAGIGNDKVIAIGPNLIDSLLTEARVTVLGGAGVDEFEFDSAGLPTTPADRVPVIPRGSVSADGFASIDYFEFENALIITPPVPDLGGPYVIAEGDPITLDARASVLNGDSGTFLWDINGDGEFDELIGDFIELSFADLAGLGIDDDGVYPIALRVTNDRGQTSDAFSSITVGNTSPTIGAAGPPNINVGGTFELSLSPFDPGDDTIATWQIDWGDGSDLVTISGDVLQATHQYLNTGNYVVTVSGRDEDNAEPLDAYVDTIAVDVAAVSPDSGGGYAIAEGEDLVLRATAPGSPVFTWTIGGVTLPETTDAELVVPWTQLVSLGLADAGSSINLTSRYSGGGADTGMISTVYTIANTAPTADFASDQASYDEGESVIVSFADSIDPSPSDQAAGFTYDYDFDNDGTFELVGVTDASASFVATQAGNQVVRGRITDVDGGVREYLVSIAVREVAPTLIVTGQSTRVEGETYSVSLSATDPGDDAINFWSVDWGDGTTSTADTASATLDHVYADDGVYAVRVTAVDADGIYVATTSVSVANVDPVLSIAGAGTATEGLDYVLSLASSDPGDDAITRWTIDWGDGTNSTVGGGATQTTHAFIDDGTFTVTVTAIDEDSAAGTSYAATNSITVVVANEAPTVRLGGNASVNEGSPYVLVLSPPDDPGDDTATTFTIDWGDGSAPETVDVPAPDADGVIVPVSVEHPYADNGTFVISVTVTDEDGVFVSPETKSVIVNDVAPTIDLVGSSRAILNQPYALTLGTIADPGTDAVTEILVDWGDDTPVQSFASLGQIAHTFASEGDFLITATLVDEDGSHIAAGTRQVTVGGSILDAGSAPRITDLIVASSTWTDGSDGNADFIDVIDGSGEGAGNGLGLSLPGEGQLRNLPWISGIDTFYIQFSEDIGEAFTAANLSLIGNATDYLAGASIQYDQDNRRGIIALASPVTTDAIILTVFDSLVDSSGNALDGEWTDSISLTSGDGVAGGQFNFRIDVLAGDVDDSDSVNVTGDVLTVFSRNSLNPATLEESYVDVTADRTVNVTGDLLAVFARNGDSLPSAPSPPPPPPGFLGEGGSGGFLPSSSSSNPTTNIDLLMTGLGQDHDDDDDDEDDDGFQQLGIGPSVRLKL